MTLRASESRQLRAQVLLTYDGNFRLRAKGHGIAACRFEPGSGGGGGDDASRLPHSRKELLERFFPDVIPSPQQARVVCDLPAWLCGSRPALACLGACHICFGMQSHGGRHHLGNPAVPCDIVEFEQWGTEPLLKLPAEISWQR